MQTSNTIQMLQINSLFAHPDNPNVMNKTNLNKLKRHIEKTGNYEPIIVRKHPKFADKFQIINGHHRVSVLRMLGYEKAAALIWQVDDGQALLLLQTLNRLSGKDESRKKTELIKKLAEKFDTKTLALLLPDSKKTIENLVSSKKPPLDNKTVTNAYLNSIVLFVDDLQYDIIINAINAACENINISSKARRQAAAMKKISLKYLEKNTCNAIAVTEICQQYLKDPE